MVEATQTQQRGIMMSDNALKHVLELREKQGTDLCLRVGVRGGWLFWDVLHNGF